MTSEYVSAENAQTSELFAPAMTDNRAVFIPPSFCDTKSVWYIENSSIDFLGFPNGSPLHVSREINRIRKPGLRFFIRSNRPPTTDWGKLFLRSHPAWLAATPIYCSVIFFSI